MTSGATQPWPIEVLSVGPASAGAVAWRRSGKLYLSAIVKATFSFAPSAVMTPTLPVPLCTAEHLNGEGPEGSLRETLDTVPELRSADVFFAGHACAPAWGPAPRVAVRLAVRAASGEMLIDKPLQVLGDRLLIPGRPPPEPTPFTRIPMCYERAYGGPDHGANPVGMGELAELAGRRRLPNIVHLAKSPRPAVEPAGFAPLSFRWPVRRRMLRQTPRHVLELPILEIPDDLNPSYFQAAPADQQARLLQGDEWIVLEGLHPVHASLEMQLPSARGVARVYLPDGSSRPIALVADMLFIDGDAEQCSITWRGSFPIPSEADLPATRIAAGVSLPDWALTLPDRFPQPSIAVRTTELPVGALPAPAGRQRTVILETSQPPDPLLALAAAAANGPVIDLNGTAVLDPIELPPPPPPPPPAGRQHTMVFEAPASPIQRPPPPGPPPLPVTPGPGRDREDQGRRGPR